MRGRVLVYGLFFLSGATALVYQVTWARSLTLVFGASHQAVAVTLGAFMAGLALGGFACGRLAKGLRRPLAFYGVLEILIAFFAFLVPTLLAVLDRAYVGLALEVEGVPWNLHLARVVLASAILLPPTFLMGGTLPVLTRFVVRRSADFGERLSALYSVNTAGAVAGTVATSFLLLPALGVAASQLLAVGVNLAVGIGALGIGWRRGAASLPPVPSGGAADETDEEEDGGQVPPPTEPPERGTWALRLAFWGTAVAGFCGLALEVMWMRGISVSTGTTAYSFGVMLAAFLTGIALGSWLYAALPLRRVGVAWKLGAVLVAAGLTSALATWFIPQLPRLAVELNLTLYESPGGVRAATTLLLSFAVMLVPCVFMGAAFPLAGEARAALRGDFGGSVGDLVGWNTLGAIAGSLAAGFVLIPGLGLQRGMLLVAGLYSAYGALVLAAATAGLGIGSRRGRVAIAAAAVALAGVTPLAVPDWDFRLLAAFRNNIASVYVRETGEVRLERFLAGTDVLYYHEGPSANVSVVESGEHRALLIDGKVVASDRTSDMYHELLLGTLPMLLHPRPHSAAVVGLGAGVTLGGVLAHPSAERVVVVEIEPGVVDAARLFAHVNGDALDDPRLEVVFQDGRNYLQTTAERFDVITADPIHPWARGAAYLYTAEYYRMLGERLSERGVMCQWLPLYELSLDDVRSVVATFADRFAHTTVWQTAFDAILIGSHVPLAVDAEALAARLAAPSVGAPLAQIGLADPWSLLCELTLSGPGLAAFTAGAVRNTDDNLYLEFSSPFSSGNPRFHDNVRAVSRGRALLGGTVAGLPSGELWRQYQQAKGETVEAEIGFEKARSAGAAAAWPPVIAELEGIVERRPELGRSRYVLSLAESQYGLALLREGDAAEARAALVRAVATLPRHAEARYRLGRVLIQQGDPEAALPHLEAAVRHDPRHARAHLASGIARQRLGRLGEAVSSFERAAAARPLFADAHYRLALALAGTGRSAAARESFEAALALKPSLPSIHVNFSAFLVGQNEIRRAVEVLDAGLDADPEDPELREIRRRLELD